MRLSSNVSNWAKLLPIGLALLLLAGCGMVRRDKGAAESGVALPNIEQPAAKGDPQKRFDAALAQMKSNQAAEAEKALVALAADFPQFAGPWTNLGIIYAKSNRNAPAVAAFIRAVNINPKNATAYNWLGILYRQARNYPLAQSAYESALKADPDFALAHLNLGILYDEYLKRPSDALPQYRAYLQLLGKDDLRVNAWIAQIEHPNPDAPDKPEQKPIKGAERAP